MLVVKLKFHGPNVVSTVTREEPLKIGCAVSFETEVQVASLSLADLKRFWDMERTFNELTKGRLHVELYEKPGP